MPKETKEGTKQLSFFFFLFTTIFGTKGQLDRFRFSLEDNWQQRENIVAWPGRDEIACRNKRVFRFSGNFMEAELVQFLMARTSAKSENPIKSKLTDCHSDFSSFHFFSN